MKKITLLVTMLFSAFIYQVQGQTVYADFEGATDGVDMSFEAWSGAGVDIIEHPVLMQGGINTSANICAYTHSGNNWWAGMASTTFITPAIDFTANPFIKMKVYADQPIPVLFKLEQDTDAGNNAEVWFNIPQDKTNQWVEVVLNFEGVTKTGLNKIVMFVDPNQDFSTASSVYYFDDIVGTDVAPASSITYSPANSATDISLLTECKITSNLHLRNIDDSEITDVSSIAWLKEGSATGVDVPFSGSISGDKSMITIIPSSELKPSTTYFYGIDDNEIEYQTGVALIGITASFQTSTAQVFEMYNNFDGTSKSVVVEAMGDETGDMGDASIVDDPIGATNKVLQWNKKGTWGGWERAHLELTAPINLNAGNNIFTINVYAQAKNDGNPNSIMLKLMDVRDEGSETGKIEKWVDLTKVEEWETLTIVLEGDYSIEYDHIFIFGGENDKTYYFDDLQGPTLKSTAGLETFESLGINMYPNPAKDRITVNAKASIEKLTIHNLLGQRVITLQPKNSDVSIDISALNKGMYILQLESEGKVATAKILKN